MSASDLAVWQAALGDRYLLTRELGGGGMSLVFVAREAGLNRDVVVKLLKADVAAGVSLERFSREIQLAASLQQANIVPLHSTGEANGTPYFTMPYVQGESLRGRLALGTAMPIPECVSILRDVARALSYAHARGVVHRDIKPDNVLLSHGTAMVTDFGIAKAISAARTMDGGGGVDASGTLTQAGGAIGTPAYMAPEQAVGEAVDARVDLYAWGVMAYEMLTGAHPFSGRTGAAQLISAHLTEVPAPLTQRRPDVSRELNDLVMRCLAKSPADRPQSADAVLAALDAVITPVASARGAALTPSSSATPRRSTLIAVAVLAVAAIGAFLSMRDRPVSSATTAADNSVAVLPLANLSGDKADDFLGIGLAEEMTRALSKTGVRVIGRVSAGLLQAKGLDDRAIAKELGVASLLTGSVQRAAGQFRINVTLVSASDGAVRWTERYDRPITNIFAVQDEIAQAVAGKLLGAMGVPRQASRVETNDPEAYALYLQAQVLFGRRTLATLRQAIGLYREAVARDPTFARAHASLAVALAIMPSYAYGETDVDMAAARDAAQRAISIDSTIAESYTALATVEQALFNNRAADSLYRRSLTLDSTVAVTWGMYGLLANRLGQPLEAHRRVARARELEPASLIARVWDAQVFLVERRFAMADSVARSVIALDSTYQLAWDAHGEALLNLGRNDEAIAALERSVAQQRSEIPSQTEGILVYAYARAGRTADAQRMLAAMQRRNGGTVPGMGVIAAAYEVMGDHQAAIGTLAQALQAHDGWLFQYNHSERYDRLRKDPRANAMLARTEVW